MKKKELLVSLILILFISNVSAGVYFSQPESIYNLGDIINMSLDINPLEDGPLKIELKCSGDELLVSYSSVPENSMDFKLPLTSAHFSGMTGNCYFNAEYKNENYKSRDFKISDKLEVRLSIDTLFANPGEKIYVQGTAKKLNGNNVEGNAEIKIPFLRKSNFSNNETNSSLNYSKEIYSGSVSNGEFNVPVDLSKNAPSGDYKIDVLVYETISDERASEGIAMGTLKIFQIPSYIEIAINEQRINPGENLSFKISLLDQSKRQMEEEVSVVIKNIESERIYEKIVNSGETINYHIPTNLNSGYYDIEVSKNEIINKKRFYVNEKQISSFEVTNDTLEVINVGNVPYNKDIEVELNGKPFIKKVKLELGESKSFKLTGDGNYDIRIHDGENSYSKNSVALTGRSIDVDEIDGNFLSIAGPVFWMFLIIVLFAGVLFFFRNSLKKKSFTSPFQRFKKKKKEDFKIKKQDKMPPGVLNASGEAEQVSEVEGHKNSASVIVLKIKNKLDKKEKDIVERTLEPLYEKKASVYNKGDYIFVIFSPLMTRTYKNEILAIKSSESIASLLKEYNKKFSNKINFGIGVNSGDIINKVENKKFKFTALDNFMSVAKKLSDISEGVILITKDLNEKIKSEIKTEKKIKDNKEVYEIKNIIDTEKNQKFINNFLERMKKEQDF